MKSRAKRDTIQRSGGVFTNEDHKNSNKILIQYKTLSENHSSRYCIEYNMIQPNFENHGTGNYWKNTNCIACNCFIALLFTCHYALYCVHKKTGKIFRGSDTVGLLAKTWRTHLNTPNCWLLPGRMVVHGECSVQQNHHPKLHRIIACTN